MKNTSKRTVVQLERHGWLLLVASFALILGFGISFLVLAGWVVDGFSTAEGEATWVNRGYSIAVGLAGLICIFILYTVFKQSELNRVRAALQEEESELSSVRARLSELSIMFQVATSLEVSLRVDSILEIIVRRVVAALRAQQASIMLIDPANQLLITRAFYGVESEYTSEAKVKLGQGIAGMVAERHEPMLLNVGSPEHGLEAFYKPHRNITSALCVPLMVDMRCVGVMNVNRINHPAPFENPQLEVLKVFAEHVASVIQRAGHMESLDKKAQGLELDNMRLTEVSKAKDIFLSTASHELKTPLTSIIGYAELLDEHSDELQEDQRQDFTRRLRTEAHQLLALVEDIMDLTRLETGKIQIHPEEVELNNLVKAAVDSTWSQARKHSIRIEAEYDETIGPMSLDETKIRQTVVNLIANAIKFSPEDGEVVVRTLRDRESAVVEVIDQGPGVAPEERGEIFSLFGQAGASRKKSNGLGIGLHLVKRIVELHGGNVGLDTRKTGGSVFWVRLPLEAVPTSEEEQAEAA